MTEMFRLFFMSGRIGIKMKIRVDEGVFLRDNMFRQDGVMRLGRVQKMLFQVRPNIIEA